MANVIVVTLGSTDDTNLITAIQALGHTVREVNHGSAETVVMVDGTTPADLIVIGPRASATTVGTKYRTVTIPVISVGAGWWGSAYGGLSNESVTAVTLDRLYVWDGSDPLNTGFTTGDTRIVYSVAQTQCTWFTGAAALGSAARIAMTRTSAGQPVVAGYATGDEMATGFFAPAKRYLFGCGRYPGDWSADGTALWSAVMSDALGDSAVPLTAGNALLITKTKVLVEADVSNPAGGTAPYFNQWQRNDVDPDDPLEWYDLTGETALTYSMVPGAGNEHFWLRVAQTDSASPADTVYTNAVEVLFAPDIADTVAASGGATITSATAWAQRTDAAGTLQSVAVTVGAFSFYWLPAGTYDWWVVGTIDGQSEPWTSQVTRVVVP
jgi:hypothetical protein